MPGLPLICRAAGTFERLLQREAAGQERRNFCGPACLQMLFRLECPDFTGSQSQLAKWCAGVESPEDREPGKWAASPFAMQRAINRFAGRRDTINWHYHIVHAAEPQSPLQEVLTRLRGDNACGRAHSNASLLLTRGGSHWVLAVGARVEDGNIVWLAVADPLLSAVRFLTGSGLATEFNRNSQGKHPDWDRRHVALIASRLPRLCRESGGDSLAGAVPSLCPAPVKLPLLNRTHHNHPLKPPEQDALVQELTGLAETAADPNAARLLEPLKDGCQVFSERPASSARVSVKGSAANVQVCLCDRAGRPLARVTLRGQPPALTGFFLLPPGAGSREAGFPGLS